MLKCVSALLFQAMVSISPSSKDEIEMDNILFPDDTDSLNPDLLSSNCVIDLDALLRQTENTQEQLKDYTVLLDSEKLKQALNVWATELNLTLEAYHRELHLQQGERGSSKAPAGLGDGRNSSREERDIWKSVGKESDEVSGKMEAGKGKDPDSIAEPEMNDNYADPATLELGTNPECSPDKDSISPRSIAPNEQMKTKGRGGDVDPGASSKLERGDGVVAHNGSDLDTDPSVFLKHSTIVDNLCGSLKENSPKQGIPEKSNNQSSNSLNSPVSMEGVSEKLQDRVSMPEGKSQESEVRGSDFVDAENDSEVDLHIDWSQVCHVKDPFQLIPQHHMAVSTLVSHCLECGCFGNAGTIFSVHTPGPRTISAKDQASKEVPSSFKSFKDTDSSVPSQAERIAYQKAASWDPNSVQTYHSTTTPGQLLSCHSVTQDSHLKKTAINGEICTTENTVSQDSAEKLNVQYAFPGEDGKLVEQEEQQQDLKNSRPVLDDSGEGNRIFDEERARFVQLYYHFLPHWRLRRMLTEAYGKEVYATWCAVITCCQGNLFFSLSFCLYVVVFFGGGLFIRLV